MKTIAVVSRYAKPGWFGQTGGRRIDAAGLEIEYALSRDKVAGTVAYKATLNGVSGTLTIPEVLNKEGPLSGVATFTEK